MQDDVQELREFCVQLAQRGVQTARRMQTGNLAQRRKADKTLVTAADEAVQRDLILAITGVFADDAIIAEESVGLDLAADRSTAKRFWVIDPIDGTRSYARGTPWYACSVAVLEAGRPTAGAVAEAGAGVVFSAAAGGGAYLGEKRIRVRDEPAGRDTFIGMPSKYHIPLPEAMTSWPNRYVIRNYGSLALHLAMVAAGMLDAVAMLEARIWDVAAGAVLVQEAGGVMTDLAGQDILPFDMAAHAVDPGPIAALAAGPRCHVDLLAELEAKG